MGHKCTLFPLYHRVSAFFDDILHKASEGGRWCESVQR
uniref:Uncharacterized protein n=1 Tax=Anguilla anguilla TaxID=7936 RepID=A0A0E9TJ48_ANGAN